MNLESATPEVATGSHPRRPPAHLSVSLRHDVPDAVSEKPTAGTLENAGTTIKPDSSPTPALGKQTSDDSEDTVGTNVNEWFERSNAQPAIAIDQDSGETSKCFELEGSFTRFHILTHSQVIRHTFFNKVPTMTPIPAKKYHFDPSDTTCTP